MINKRITTRAMAAVAIVASSAGLAADRLGDFAALDTAGEFHQFSRYGDKESLVLMAVDSRCEAMA